MNGRLLMPVAVVLFASLPLRARAQDTPVDLTRAVHPFVQRYCVVCHDDKSQKGDRSFEAFAKRPGSADHHDTLAEILEQLQLGEMPPRKKDVAQPTDTERQAVVAAITKQLASIESSQRPAHTVLRRLTRYEYNRTMRDLLGIDPEAADMTRLFPPDQREDGFATVGDAQVLSDYQLSLYMETARRYLDQAFVFGQERPQRQTWVFKPADLNGEKRNVGTVNYRVWAPDLSHLDIGHGQPVERAPTYPKQFADNGTPVSGLYRIGVRATAVGRQHPYDPEIFPHDLSVPLKLGIWHAPDRNLLSKSASEGRVLAGVFDLSDNSPQEFEVTTWMPAGSIPFVNWMNGMGASKRVLRLVVEKYHPEAERRSQTKVDALRAKGLPVPEDALVQKVWISDLYQGPRVRIFQLSLEGPLIDQWPPAGHRSIVGETTNATQVNIPRTLTTFASRAFRRPVATSEVSHYMDYVESRIAAGVSREEAIKLGLTAILTSPRFLFLDEGDAEQGVQLDDYELASRLSYALWSSMPDASLLQRAAAGELRKPDVLTSEIERLLNDPRSDAFVERFTEAWLRLDKIGSMPPSQAQYPSYYYDRLETAMKTETRLFFSDVLKRNRPVTDFLGASDTFVNDALAKHYGLSDVTGEEFRRVTLPTDIRRSGILGHASVLTASANGVETSPVVRGVFVLESILGTPPSPPPPDVPPIEPDTRGATTIRQQLAKHRNVATCADCHSKIDPWGFALEFYDPIGGFRTHYPIFTGGGRIAERAQGKPVDGSGELSTGEFIRDEAGLTHALLNRRDQFARNLTEKLLTHSTGREMTFRDRTEVDRIVKDLALNGYGFRDLVHTVLAGSTFQKR